MIRVSSDADRVVVAKTQEAGQGHLFEGWDELSADEQKGLLDQLRDVDLPDVAALVKEYRRGTQKKRGDKVRQPVDYLPIPQTPEALARHELATDRGETVLREGKIAILMAAGGLGTRLGCSEPKGNLPVGPVSGKPLYRIHADKIRALSHRYRSAVPLFLVTSPRVHDKTVAAFKESDYFGLNRQDVKFLVQRENPVIDRRGRFVFSARGQIARRPDGHGAALTKILEDETFLDLERRGIEHVYFCQVDNPLVRIVDPAFVGYHLDGSDVTCKTVLKVDPDEEVGIFCVCDGQLRVVEYSELSAEDRTRLLPDGRLALSAGNVAVHLFSMDLLRRIREESLELPRHAVPKFTRYLDREGSIAIPERPNTVAFETYIFDALAWSNKTVIVETCREQEFSPIKRSNGGTSIDAARLAMSRLHRGWLSDVGVQFKSLNGESNGIKVEISPLFASDPEELRRKIELPLEVTSDIYLE